MSHLFGLTNNSLIYGIGVVVKIIKATLCRLHRGKNRHIAVVIGIVNTIQIVPYCIHIICIGIVLRGLHKGKSVLAVGFLDENLGISKIAISFGQIADTPCKLVVHSDIGICCSFLIYS